MFVCHDIKSALYELIFSHILSNEWGSSSYGLIWKWDTVSCWKAELDNVAKIASSIHRWFWFMTFKTRNRMDRKGVLSKRRNRTSPLGNDQFGRSAGSLDQANIKHTRTHTPTHPHTLKIMQKIMCKCLVHAFSQFRMLNSGCRCFT